MTEAERLLRECRDYLIYQDHEPQIFNQNPDCVGCKLREHIDAYLARCEKHTEPSGEEVREAFKDFGDGLGLRRNVVEPPAERRPSAEEVREACAKVCESNRHWETAGRVYAKALRALDLSTVGGKEKA